MSYWHGCCCNEGIAFDMFRSFQCLMLMCVSCRVKRANQEDRSDYEGKWQAAYGQTEDPYKRKWGRGIKIDDEGARRAG